MQDFLQLNKLIFSKGDVPQNFFMQFHLLSMSDFFFVQIIKFCSDCYITNVNKEIY